MNIAESERGVTQALICLQEAPIRLQLCFSPSEPTANLQTSPIVTCLVAGLNVTTAVIWKSPPEKLPSSPSSLQSSATTEKGLARKRIKIRFCGTPLEPKETAAAAARDVLVQLFDVLISVTLPTFFFQLLTDSLFSLQLHQEYQLEPIQAKSLENVYIGGGKGEERLSSIAAISF